MRRVNSTTASIIGRPWGNDARAYAARSALAALDRGTVDSKAYSIASSGNADGSGAASHGGVSNGFGRAVARTATVLRARTVRRLCVPCMAKNVIVFPK